MCTIPDKTGSPRNSLLWTSRYMFVDPWVQTQLCTQALNTKKLKFFNLKNIFKLLIFPSILNLMPRKWGE